MFSTKRDMQITIKSESGAAGCRLRQSIRYGLEKLGSQVSTGVICLCIAALGFSVTGAAYAQSTDGGVKIGYVDAVQLIEKAPQGENALKNLEAEFGPRDEELKALRDKIRSLEEDLEKNSLLMDDGDRREKETFLRDSQRQLKRSRDEFREDYNVRRNEELADLQKVVTQAIVEIAKSEGYHLIVQESVYAAEEINLTDRVLEKLRSESTQ